MSVKIMTLEDKLCLKWSEIVKKLNNEDLVFNSLSAVLVSAKLLVKTDFRRSIETSPSAATLSASSVPISTSSVPIIENSDEFENDDCEGYKLNQYLNLKRGLFTEHSTLISTWKNDKQNICLHHEHDKLFPFVIMFYVLSHNEYQPHSSIFDYFISPIMKSFSSSLELVESTGNINSFNEKINNYIRQLNLYYYVLNTANSEVSEEIAKKKEELDNNFGNLILCKILSDTDLDIGDDRDHGKDDFEMSINRFLNLIYAVYGKVSVTSNLEKNDGITLYHLKMKQYDTKIDAILKDAYDYMFVQIKMPFQSKIFFDIKHLFTNEEQHFFLYVAR